MVERSGTALQHYELSTQMPVRLAMGALQWSMGVTQLTAHDGRIRQLRIQLGGS